jgi:Histidine kinase-, DNA gyrase B-, and HSP90-like ATPase
VENPRRVFQRRANCSYSDYEIHRIARESLRNALRHAQAGHIETEITYGESLRLHFRDDGKGIDPSVVERGGRSGHWGLPGIRERAEQIGAELSVWSELGAGTEVELSIPGSIAYEASPTRPRFRFFVRKRNKIMSTDPSLIRTGAGLCLNNGSKSEYRVAKFHFR